jgi:hypothetical protein
MTPKQPTFNDSITSASKSLTKETLIEGWKLVMDDYAKNPLGRELVTPNPPWFFDRDNT